MPKETRKNRKRKRKRPDPKPSTAKWRWALYGLIAVVLLGGYYYKTLGTSKYPVDLKQVSPADISLLQGNETRETLSPALFVGETTIAYAIAEQNRALLDSMYCYCYCEKTIGHQSLLSCFTDRHAAACDICRDEAIFAFDRLQKGDSLLDIRKAVDKKFWRPFS